MMATIIPIPLRPFMEELWGYIERLTFQNGETGYTVAWLQHPQRKELICLVGIMPALQPGESIRCTGQWKHHLVHGLQFEVVSSRIEIPSDLIGIRKYLGSGLIKGIGPSYAERIVEHFGTDTLEVIDRTPARLNEIRGIGPKRIETIKTCWQEQRSIREVMMFLQGYGVSPAFAQKIFKHYRDESIAKVKENPYCLARDIWGIGFKTADTLAQQMGIASHSPQRLDAGVEHVLSQLSNEGHVCYPKESLIATASETLEVESTALEERVHALQEEKRIEISNLLQGTITRPFVWLRPLYLAEIGIARELRRIQYSQSLLRSIDVVRAIEWVQTHLNIQLAPSQREAVCSSVTGKIHLITGPPGTGKSTIINAILAITSRLTSAILLAAPTGRAAKRMTEITGHPASTIHSLLEFDFRLRGFKRNRDHPLDCDLLIVDEASMMDTLLMYSLLKAIPSHARLIFVGDVHQLPSVGPGNVLNDLLSSMTLPMTRLTDIFRQAAGSQIITNAHRINQGLFPHLHSKPDSDFFFLESEEPQEVLHTIVKLVSHRLPNRYGFHPMRDIQVLAPMRKGIIGTHQLNHTLQEHLNPQSEAIQRFGEKFQVGDKVMQIRNNYSREVFNGDIGYIQAIDAEEQEIIISFEGRDVLYSYTDLDELVLAYAISVHKFQGSECPCVVMPVHTSHFMLLHRNLLYTGVTRGRKLVVLVGTKRALACAVRNQDVQHRHTGLKQHLMEVL